MHDIQYFQGERINTLYHASKYAIERALPEGSWVSIIGFNSNAFTLSGFVQVDTASRQTLVRKLPQTGDLTTCIPCGLDKAVSVCHPLILNL